MLVCILWLTWIFCAHVSSLNDKSESSWMLLAEIGSRSMESGSVYVLLCFSLDVAAAMSPRWVRLSFSPRGRGGMLMHMTYMYAQCTGRNIHIPRSRVNGYLSILQIEN